MWENDWEIEEDQVEPGFHDELAAGSRISSGYLRKVVASNMDKLPLPLLAAYQMKITRMQNGVTNKVSCPYCGISLQSRKTWSLDVKVNFRENRKLYGKCKACDSRIYVGDLRKFEKLNLDESTVDPLNETLNSTCSSIGRSMFFPAQKFLQTSTPKPKNSGKLTPLPTSNAKKKRSSALSKLLQDEDSEIDRSLNSFLSSLSQ